MALSFLALLVLLPLFFCLSYYFGRVLLRPLLEHSSPTARMQFHLTDYYALLLQLGLLGALIVGPKQANSNEWRVVTLILVWALFAWWWWLGVRRLSRAGVHSAWKRAVVLSLAVPFAFGNFFMIALLLPFAEGRSGRGLNSLFLLGFLFTLFMVFTGCRKIAQWAVGRDRAVEGPATGEKD